MNMNTIALTGLAADLPIGAMAAFGILRVVQRIGRLEGSRLSWIVRGSGFIPRLHTPAPISEDELAEALLTDLRSTLDRPELAWSDTIKSAKMEDFARACEQFHPSEDWFQAMASDLDVDEEDYLEPTPFDMSVARQRFLADARALSRDLASPSARGSASPFDSYREALFGPWRYRDNQHSLGWDPSTLKLGAFTFKAPTAMANTGVRAAVWLAFESLPLFPCFYEGPGLATRAFRQRHRECAFRWPVWGEPISLCELESLLAWNQLTSEKPDRKQVELRGVLAVYSSSKFKPNKYMVSFRAAELVAGGVLLCRTS